MKSVITLKRRLIIYILTIGLSTVFSSCEKISIYGQGNTITVQKSLPSFHAVEAFGDIRVRIVQGNQQELSITGFENLLAVTETEVRNGVLRIKFSDDVRNVINSNVVANIILPAVKSGTMHGNGDMQISNFSQGDSISLRVNGNAHITVQSSLYRVAVMDVNGNGKINAREMHSIHASLAIHGNGDIALQCSDNLKARIYGNGVVRYSGNPVLDVQISGNGHVLRL